MTENRNQPSQADGERQNHRLLQNFIFYGVAAFFLFLALTGSARFSLNIGFTVLVCALAWWSVLIVFWSRPAFCHFETEHDWCVTYRRFCRGIWGVIHGSHSRNPASSFGQRREHQLDCARPEIVPFDSAEEPANRERGGLSSFALTCAETRRFPVRIGKLGCQLASNRQCRTDEIGGLPKSGECRFGSGLHHKRFDGRLSKLYGLAEIVLN